MTEATTHLVSKQNPKDILVIIAIMAALFGFFSLLFV